MQNLSLEGLTRIGQDGRVEPRLAEGWSFSPDRLIMTLRLRPGVKFHDGSNVTADTVAEILRISLPGFMGPAFRDVDRIASVAADRIEIHFTEPSRFSEEALELNLSKLNEPTVGTGPFSAVDPKSLSELRANPDYYLGPPNVDRVLVTNYPSVRSAWADMLRDQIDMLYEVGTDALDSLQGGNNISLFSFTRPYQYVVFLNTRVPSLRAARIRRALNLAIDRSVLVQDAFGGHALPSSGPIWPNHWALGQELSRFSFDPSTAASLLSSEDNAKGSVAVSLRFTCLVPPDYERIALVVSRQLEAVGVKMDLKEASIEESLEALRKHDYEAVLFDMVSGPGMFRLYGLWHTGGSLNIGQSTSPEVDAALDRIRHAKSDDQYRSAVAAFQKAMLDDPPAIFLAWSERARAVSRRFDVAAQPDRDILLSLRLWKPALGDTIARSN